MSVRIPPSVPAGWAPSWNDQYQTWFYINTKSKQSQWDVPTSPVHTRTPSPARGGDADDKLSPLVASPADDLSARFETNMRVDASGSSSNNNTNNTGVMSSTPTPTVAQPPAETTRQAPEVPQGWLPKWNEEYGAWFYYNLVTRDSTWDQPTAPAGDGIVLDDATRRDLERSVSVVSGWGQPASPGSSSEPSSRQPQSREDVPEVPEGWSAQWNDMYQVWFYVNTATQETSWEKPVLPVDRPLTDRLVSASPVPSATPRPEAASSPRPSLTDRASLPGQTAQPEAPELPSGWAARFNEQYQTWFYVNTLTGKSSWEKPTTPAALPTGPSVQAHQRPPSAISRPSSAIAPAVSRDEPRPASSAAPPPATPNTEPDLPEGWVKRFNEQYQTWFYVDTRTGKSQWDKPNVPKISVNVAGPAGNRHESDEEMARRLQAEEDGFSDRAASPMLPPRPRSSIAASSNPDQPPSYEFAVAQPSNPRRASYNGPNRVYNNSVYGQSGQSLYPPGAVPRPTSAASNTSFNSLVPPEGDTKGKKARKKRSWMLPAGVAAGGVAGLGAIGAGIYALTGSDIGDRIINKVTGDEDGDEETIAGILGDAADAFGGE